MLWSHFRMHRIAPNNILQCCSCRTGIVNARAVRVYPYPRVYPCTGRVRVRCYGYGYNGYTRTYTQLLIAQLTDHVRLGRSLRSSCCTTLTQMTAIMTSTLSPSVMQISEALRLTSIAYFTSFDCEEITPLQFRKRVFGDSIWSPKFSLDRSTQLWEL